MVCDDNAIPPPKIEIKREHEDEETEEVITKKQKKDEKLEAKNESDVGCGSLKSSDNGISDHDVDKHDTPASLNEKYAAPKTIFVRNLSYSVERADMEDIFKDCGEVVDVRFNTDREGRFKGHGYVEFGTAEAVEKALELNNTELLYRRIKVNIAVEKSEYPPYRSSFHTGGDLQPHTVKGFDASLVESKPKSPATPNETNGASKTIYVRNLSYSVERADMEEIFKDCGEIVDVRLHTDHYGNFKGYGHVQFATAEAAQKALAFNKKVYFNRLMFVGLALEMGKYAPNGSSSLHKDERLQSQTVPVKCSDTSLAEGKLSCAKDVKDVEMFDAASAEKKIPETSATQEEKNAASKTVCMC